MHGASVVIVVSAWIEYPLRVKNLFQLFLNDGDPLMERMKYFPPAISIAKKYGMSRLFFHQ